VALFWIAASRVRDCSMSEAMADMSSSEGDCVGACVRVRVSVSDDGCDTCEAMAETSSSVIT
jgi:hypothetical protein